MDVKQIRSEQEACMAGIAAGKTITQIAEELGMTRYSVRRRINGAKKRERLDPEIVEQLDNMGHADLAGLHSGWIFDKTKKKGRTTGGSLYFYLGPDEEKISFADAIKDVLSEIPRLEPVVLVQTQARDPEKANWLALADLHMGGHYGDPRNESEANEAIDDVTSRMPAATHAVFLEMGDLLEANDHKGLTPNSGNMLSVKREAFLEDVKAGVRVCRRVIYRLLETHDTVEAHFIKGNHDPSAHIAVMLSLAEHFGNNPRVEIVVTDDEYRVIPWGLCAAFPHHGDTLNWKQLKDVFADQFADEWAAAKMHRHIMTAHFHHLKVEELVGATAQHFQTIHRPNNWAKGKGLFARGSLTAITVHKTKGLITQTQANILNTVHGK